MVFIRALILSVLLRIMSAFKRHLVAAENPDLVNAVSLFEDIELYLSLGDSVINRPKKEMQATHISKFVVSIQSITQMVELLVCRNVNPKVEGFMAEKCLEISDPFL